MSSLFIYSNSPLFVLNSAGPACSYLSGWAKAASHVLVFPGAIAATSVAGSQESPWCSHCTRYCQIFRVLRFEICLNFLLGMASTKYLSSPSTAATSSNGSESTIVLRRYRRETTSFSTVMCHLFQFSSLFFSRL